MLTAVVPRLVWTGNGSSASIALSVSSVPITFPASSAIKVKQLIVATGAVSTMVENVDYSISPTSVAPGFATAATLIRIAGNLPSGTKWVIYLDQAFEQTVDILPGGAFSSGDVELGLDVIARYAQQIGDATARSLKASKFDDLSAFDPELPPFSGNAGKVPRVKSDESGVEWAVGADIQIGTVSTLPAGSSATAEIIDLGAGVFALDLGIPRGNTGASGPGSGDMLGSQNLADVASAAAAFANIKQAASDSATGVVELATDAEAQAKSDTARALTPANLAALGATQALAGLVEQAADAEVQAGADTGRYITPAGLQACTATETRKGVAELATDAEAAAGTDTERILTPAQLHEARADVASAATCNIGAAASNFVRITGTTTITAFDTVAAGVWRWVTFEGILTLNHNGTSLICPGVASITTAANDRMLVRSLGSGNWIVLDYVKASGLPVTDNRVFKASYVSSEQTITSAGQLVLPHGLGAVPKLVFAYIVCQSAEANYVEDDTIPVTLNWDVESNPRQGSYTIDATNITIRFTTATGVFAVANKTTGAHAVLTNANWRLVVTAYA